MSSIRAAALLVGIAFTVSGAGAAVPPFGTLLGQWDLPLSGLGVGAGMTWRPDSGRIYLIDQGYSGSRAFCRSFRPENPLGTLRDEQWQFPDLGVQGTKDVPQGIAWDSDSGCFWVSTFIDNNSNNCCLLRMSPAGVWTGDSWQLPSGDFIYLRGIDRSADLGTFYGGGSWSSEAGLARFDPYTGTVIARVMKGSTTAAGCVPADSNYVITTRGYYFMKLSSTGGELDSAWVTDYVPFDLTVVVPDVPSADDTVCFYAITRTSNNTLQRFSTGMNWSQLSPSSRWNVRPVAILAPTGAPDSGSAVIPRVVVRNTGVQPADLVRVWFKVDHHGTQRYLDSARIVNLPARSVDTVELSPWVVNGRDSMTGIAWVYWAGDSLRRDDTLRNRFLALVKDAGVRSVILPSDTLDSGIVFIPQASVWNFGNARESIPVRFDIKSWTSTGYVFVNPGGARSAGAVSQYQTVPGVYVPCFRSVLPRDMHPENDALCDTFWVRGTIVHDIGLAAPQPQRVDTSMTVVPRCTLTNYGHYSELCRVWFELRNPAGVLVGSESVQISLPAGNSALVSFSPVRLRTPGRYAASCSTFLELDQNMLNDISRWTIEVTTGVGEASAGLERPGDVVVRPSIVTGRVVELRCSLSDMGSASVEVCDVAGRAVVRHQVVLGAEGRFLLDISGLATGVYVIRLDASNRTASCRFVVGNGRR